MDNNTLDIILIEDKNTTTVVDQNDNTIEIISYPAEKISNIPTYYI